MNGGIVPVVLLGVTLGLMLASVPRGTAIIGLLSFAAVALLGLVLPIGMSPDVVFVGLWLSMIAAAGLVYFPLALWSKAAVPLCLNAGFWLAASAALTDNRSALAFGIIPALIAFPARWLMRRKFDIGIKVVASWMIAIASLSLLVSLIPTPGYKPDHME